MQITTKAIVLSCLKYGDTSLIVKAFTATDGLKTYLLRGVRASRKGKLKPAYFQPLTQLEMVVSHRNKGTLEHIREARLSYPYHSVHTDLTKKTISMFLAEVLLYSIREEERNQALFTFLEKSLQWLDAHEKVVNFHLLFLLELCRYLGIYPDTAHIQAPYFDLSEGCFVKVTPLSPSISGEELSHFRTLLGMEFDEIHNIGLGKASRNTLMNSLLTYYEIHLQGFRKPRSLAVLNEVFS
jgi:DNA repair protein RecO (recombination protein O)